MKKTKSRLEKIPVDYVISGEKKKNLKLTVYGGFVEVKGNVLNEGTYSHSPKDIINMANRKLIGDYPNQIITCNFNGRNYLLKSIKNL